MCRTSVKTSRTAFLRLNVRCVEFRIIYTVGNRGRKVPVLLTKSSQGQINVLLRSSIGVLPSQQKILNDIEQLQIPVCYLLASRQNCCMTDIQVQICYLLTSPHHYCMTNIQVHICYLLHDTTAV